MNDLKETENPPVNEELAETPVEQSGLWSLLHNEAESHFEEIQAPQENKSQWTIILIVASVVLIGSIIGGLFRFNQIRSEGLVLQQTAQAEAGLISAQETETAKGATATAQMGLSMEFQAHATRRAATASALAQATTQHVQAGATAQAETAATETQLALSQDINYICRNASAYTFEIISGPTLSPTPGSRYTIGRSQYPVLATWTIKNSGKCNWDQVSLWSVTEAEYSRLILRQDGALVTPVAIGARTLLAPGDQMDVVIPFPITEAQNIDDEWALAVNGILLSDQSHLVLQVENWVTSIQPSPTPTNTPKTPRPRNQSGDQSTPPAPGPDTRPTEPPSFITP